MALKQKHQPITAAEAQTLFADLAAVPALVLAVSGGPDSTALLWLAARWRASLKKGPRLTAVTIDHGLRSESAREAREVKRLALQLDVTHRTLRWQGPKPRTGLPAAAREARYGLLARAARSAGAVHIVTGHTSDDQAETILMRLARGSGIAGLAAMAQQSQRDGLTLCRPLLGVPKLRLVATLDAAGIRFASDPTNHDPAFLRPRLRALMPALAGEGIDGPNLARLSGRLARANDALDTVVDHALRALVAVEQQPPRWTIDARAFASLPAEIRLRLLVRAINANGHEGPAELGKAEILADAFDRALLAGAMSGYRGGSRFRRSLAGAVVALERGYLSISSAPPRRTPGRGKRQGA